MTSYRYNEIVKILRKQRHYTRNDKYKYLGEMAVKGFCDILINITRNVTV